MNEHDLRKALAIVGGRVRIATDTLTPNVAALLRTTYGGAPIAIEAAHPGPGDGSNGAVVVRGTSTFLNVKDAPVELHAHVDSAGNAQLLLKYDVLGDRSAPGSWKFSHSFPTLPKVVDWTRPMNDSNTAPLDELPFFDASFFVVSQAQHAPVFDVPLAPGINFVGHLMPTGIDVVEFLLSGAGTMTVYGTVNPAETASTLPALRPAEYAWSSTAVPPDITLQAALTGTHSVGRLQLDKLSFRLYSPASQAWLEKHPTYQPVFGYSAKLAIPSAHITVDVFAALELGATEMILFGNFTGVTLGKLAGLADIAGTSDLIAQLPDSVKSAGDALGKLELMNAGLSISLANSKLALGWVSLTVGMPELRWNVWADHFEIDSIACRFLVTDPFKALANDSPRAQRLGVTFYGAMKIEGVPVDIVATNDDGFVVYAELGAAQTIPLKSLMEKYVPGVPPPGDLTVDKLRVSVAPGKSYAMAMSMAQQPHPWIIPLGPKQLTVSDVTLSFVYPTGGPAGGSFAGTIALGKAATLAIDWTIPGPVVLKAALPHISLTDLAREIANVGNLTLPPSFPELALNNSTVSLTRQSSAAGAEYDFRLATTVAIGDAANLKFAAVVLKSPQSTGFAAGIWTGAWPHGKTGWSPGSLWQPLSALTIESAGLFICSVAPSAAQLRTIVPTSDVPALLQQKFELKAGVNFYASMRLQGSVAVLRQLFGDIRFDLFAALGTDRSTALVARVDFDQNKGAFTFHDFTLAWNSTSSANVDIAAAAAGTLSIGGESLRFVVAGRVSSDGSAALGLSVQDWVHPFGYQRLVVQRFGVELALSPAGVTIELDGTFEFKTKDDKAFLFAVAGAITDFEAPTAIAFALKSESPGKLLKISEVIEGITTIDVTSFDTPAGFTPWALEVRIIDLFLAIEELSFWAVLVDRVQIAGKTYTKGFGFRGSVTLFGKPVVLYVEVEEAQKKFAGSAEFPESIVLGKVLTLSRPTGPKFAAANVLAGTGVAAGKGPVLAVSSYIDEQHPNYLLVAAHVELFDIIKADIYGKATNDGMQFSYDLAAGTAGQGAWAAQHIDILVSREKLAFGANVSYQVGLKNVSLGGFEIFPGLSVPRISLPDFHIKLAASVGATASPPKFHLGGSLDFEFMGLSLSPSFTLDLDLANAPSELAKIGPLLLAWIEDHLKELLKSLLNVFAKFEEWVKKNFEAFKDAAKAVAKVLSDVFGKGEDAAREVLHALGYAQSAIEDAVSSVYALAKKACAASQAVSKL